MRRNTLVGYVETIRADRRDAAIMLQFARAKAREDLKEAAEAEAFKRKWQHIPTLGGST